jgi:hypothetical protein
MISVLSNVCRTARGVGPVVVFPFAPTKSAVMMGAAAVAAIARRTQSARMELAKLPRIPARGWPTRDVVLGMSCTGATRDCSNRWSAMSPTAAGALIMAIMIVTNRVCLIPQATIPCLVHGLSVRLTVLVRTVDRMVVVVLAECAKREVTVKMVPATRKSVSRIVKIKTADRMVAVASVANANLTRPVVTGSASAKPIAWMLNVVMTVALAVAVNVPMD